MFQFTRALVVLFFLASCGVTRDSGALGEVPEGGHGEVEAAVSDQHEIDGYVELARAAFAALKSGDIEDYGSFAPGEADYHWLLEAVSREVGSEEFEEWFEARAFSDLDPGTGDVDSRDLFAVLFAEQFARAFSETRASSSDVIDWASAVFDGIDRSRLRKRPLAGFECVDVYFWVTVDGERYTFKLFRTVEASERKISLTAVVFKGATASPLLLPEDRPLRPDTLEGAAKLVFEALKAGEYARYKPLLPTYEDINWYQDQALRWDDSGPGDYLEIMTSPSSLEIELAQLGEGGVPPGSKTYESEFNLTREESGEGIDWSSAAFAGLHNPNHGLESQQNFGWDGLEFPLGTWWMVSFWVRDDERLHTFSLMAPIKSPSGWCVPFPVQYGPGEIRRPQLPSSADVAFEEAAKLAFRALQSGSFTEYGPLVPTQESLEWLMTDISRANLGLEKFNRLMAAQGGKEEVLANKRETCKKDFIAAREKSARAFDWFSATFAGLDRELLTWWVKQGVKRVRTGFWVEAEGAIHMFRFDEAIQHPNGVLIEGLEYVGEHSR